VKGLNALGTDLTPQCSKDDRDHIKQQLASINSRWAKVSNQLAEIKRRLVKIQDILIQADTFEYLSIIQFWQQTPT